MLPSDGVASFWPLSWLALLMFLLTTSSAPPDAAPETTLIKLPPDFCQVLIAGLGPTYAASSCPASSAVASSVPVLNGYSFSVTFLPRLVAKKPSLTPISAGAWVMFSRKPSRSTTFFANVSLAPPPPTGAEPQPGAEPGRAAAG